MNRRSFAIPTRSTIESKRMKCVSSISDIRPDALLIQASFNLRDNAVLLVRPMLPAHLPEMLDMWVAAWQAAYPAIDFEARRGWAADHFAALERSGSVSVIALCDGSIVGALIVDPQTGYLDQIVVAREQ